MGLFDRRDNAADLSRLLDQERNAILKGDFDTLRRLVSEKARLVALTAKDRPDGDSLMRLRQLAARNHTLLDAAAQGIRSVSGGLGGRSAQSPDLETYDNQGRRNTGLEGSGSIERRV